MTQAYQPMFPKPGKKSIPTVRRIADESVIGGFREILNLKSQAGRAELKRRHREAWERDFGRCGICKFYVPWGQSVAEHIIPKGHGGGTHNDMTFNLQPAHRGCNMMKGSRRGYEISRFS